MSPKKLRWSQSSNQSDKLKYSINPQFSHSSLTGNEAGNLSFDLGIMDRLAPSTRVNPFKPENAQNI